MPDIDERLHDLAAHIRAEGPEDYPERVLMQIALRRGVRRRRLRRLVATASALAIALAAVLAVPATRSALAGWFDFRGIDLSRGPSPSVPPRSLDRLGAGLGLGRSTTLADAQSSAGFTISVPRALPSPDAVYVLDNRGTGIVSLVYTARAGLRPAVETNVGLVLTELPGTARPFFAKVLNDGARAESVRVGAVPGVFITGPQELLNLDEYGRVIDVSARLSASTLIWSAAGVTYRIEADLSRAAAIRIGASMNR